MGLDYIRDKTHPSPRNFVDYALRTTDFPWLRSQRPWLTWKNLRWSTVKRMDSIWVKRLILETCACFFFHSLVVPTCQETSQVEVPSDLFCGWQQPWRCWTVLGLMLSPKLLSSNASGGRGFQGLRGCGAWGYRAQGLTWTKNLPW